MPAALGLALVLSLSALASGTWAVAPLVARAEGRESATASGSAPIAAGTATGTATAKFAENPATAPATAIRRAATNPNRSVSLDSDLDLLSRLNAPRTPRPMRVVVDDAPLTRAAARRRVDELSPVPWLERFGAVAVERRD